jgi:hypothetical protein
MSKLPPTTTTQSLGSLLKSARDIMRKDKGLNGDIDHLPLLTWIIFLKFLNDLEIQREQEAKLAGKKFKSAIEKPYRWHDWAVQADGLGARSKDGRDRSPQRSGDWRANGSAHERLGNRRMTEHSRTNHMDRPEVGPCRRPESRKPVGAFPEHEIRVSFA